MMLMMTTTMWTMMAMMMAKMMPTMMMAMMMAMKGTMTAIGKETGRLPRTWKDGWQEGAKENGKWASGNQVDDNDDDDFGDRASVMLVGCIYPIPTWKWKQGKFLGDWGNYKRGGWMYENDNNEGQGKRERDRTIFLIRNSLNKHDWSFAGNAVRR